MSDAHPSAFALESTAAGHPSPDTTRHLAECEACRAHVETLENEARAFAGEPLPDFLREPKLGDSDDAPNGTKGATTEAQATRTAEARPETLPRKGTLARVLPFAATVLPLAAAAVAVFALQRPVPHEDPQLEPTATSPAVRFKGGATLAVVRDREGTQDRFTGKVAVGPNDALRIELGVDAEGTYEAGLLGEDGSWMVLLAPTMLRPGAHFSERAARFDAHPEAGVLVAGPVAEVEAARKSRDFSRVIVLPVEVARDP
jgi:hypothetical protein